MEQIKEFVNNNRYFVLVLLTFIILWYQFYYKRYSELSELIDEISDYVETPTKEEFREFTSDTDFLRDGKYVIRGSRNNKFCTDDPNGMICNVDQPGPREMFTIQHLGDNNYAIQGFRSGMWCTLTPTGMRCNSPTVGDWQVFKLHPLGGYKYGIQSKRNKQWCIDSGHGLECDVSSMNGNDFQQFEFFPIHYNNIK